MFNKLATKESVEKTKLALEANGFKVLLAKNGAEAKAKALEIIPKSAEVMTMTSITNDTIGLNREINESGNFNSVRAKLAELGADKSKGREMKRLGAAPEYTTGSIHAVTEDGKILVASNTGSQLGAYAYGAGNVIWVIGAQKIVKDLDRGMQRVYDYVLPLESERANKAYGITSGSFVSKLLIVHREITPDRIHVIIVNEALGF